MREVIYHINDHEYMRRHWGDVIDVDDLLKGLPGAFVCDYTLISEDGGDYPNKHRLTDASGHKVDIGLLNGYQRGILLESAVRHFSGKEADMFGILSFVEVRTYKDREEVKYGKEEDVLNIRS